MYYIINTYKIKSLLTKTGALGVPLRLRLFLFLAALILMIVLAISAVFLLNGNLSAGIPGGERPINKELDYAYKDAGDDDDLLQYSLKKAQSSHFFIVLDTNINEPLANVENAQAELFIKNMESHVRSGISPTLHLLRGPPEAVGLK